MDGWGGGGGGGGGGKMQRRWSGQLFQKNQEARALCIYNRKSVHFKQNTVFRLLSVPSQSCARVQGVQYGEMRDLLNHFAVSNRIYIAS